MNLPLAIGIAGEVVQYPWYGNGLNIMKCYLNLETRLVRLRAETSIECLEHLPNKPLERP